MNTPFSPYLTEKKPIIASLINALGDDYPFISVLGTDVNGTDYAIDKSSSHIGFSDVTEMGFVIKVYDGEFYAEYATDQLDEATLSTVIDRIKQLMKAKRTIPSVPAGLVSETPLTKAFNRQLNGPEISQAEIMNALKTIQQDTMRVDEALINVKLGFSVTWTHKLYMSKQKTLTQVYPWVNMRAFALSKQEDNTKYAFDGDGGMSIKDALTTLKTMAKDTAELAVALLNAHPPKPGTYSVITDPSISGLIAHEAFGHGVELDMFVKDRAEAKHHMEKTVATPLVSMHDGASALTNVASYFFDDDGVLAQDTEIIKHGVLKRGISDLLSAMQLNLTPTGNGRRESFKRKSYSRMTNTFFKPGTDDLATMIQSIDHGYLLVQTNNGMEDPKNWGIQCTAHYGKEIKNGKFTGKLISPVVLSGHVINLLTSISAVSKDFKMIGSGFCGKGYKEWVPVSDGGPYLKAEVKIG